MEIFTWGKRLHWDLAEDQALLWGEQRTSMTLRSTVYMVGLLALFSRGNNYDELSS